ncbi:unnamed protein product [Prorocentrum cordatum]|uniref:Reverse transcriptase Ty1/copia-type domain-containing protein n=1 Tax=Prorocentrum cordatum TaxID=2364126 RepID=A0ABN9UMB8_9DINO|nr:unnamed protein product [Polarella glacialis]
MADEPTTMGDLGEHDEGFYQNLGRRRDAAKAYFAANMSRAVREALAARNRPLAKEFQIGEYVYFWRRDKGESDLIKSYWKGPAMVTQVEYTDDPDKLRQSVIWCVHNNTLLRTTRELLRPELPEERRQREEADDAFGLPLSTAERLLKKLKSTTGSIKYKDCVGDALGDPEGHVDDGRPEDMDMDATGVDTDGKVEGPVEERAHRDERTRSSEEAEPAEREVKEEQPQSAAAESRPETDPPEADGRREPHLEAPSQEKEEDAKPEAIVEKRKVDDRDELLESINAARRLDGLKPLAKRPRITPMETETIKTDTGDDELLLLYEDEAMIHLTNAAKRDAVVEARLTPDEKVQFDEAKTKALLPWIENQAWQAVDEATAGAGEVYLILLILCQQSWKMVAADVKSAFLQAKDIRGQGVRIFSRPTKDIRRRLAKMMGLKDDEILQMLKPAFGDVRAPRQWNQTITEAMIDIGFLQHQLDRCCFLSYRIAADGDDPFLVWSADDGQNYVLDGILGLHVDDFIGGGENLECEAGLTDKQAYEGTFLDRVQTLSRRFKFGKWEFQNGIVFCGMETTQSQSRNEIEVKAEQYIHKVKPISIEKVRRQHPDDLCTPKEISQLRGLNGAMQWPASQCMVQAAATVSFAQGDVSKATVGSLLEANKSLRFLKASGDVGIRIRYVSKWEQLRLGVYWDASWATRLNGESQGGYMIFAIEDDRIDDGQATFLVIIDWTSKKLVRICRSSLSGEAQAAANAVDALEFAKTMLTTMLYPNMQLTGPDMLQVLGRSPCITDCKALYDAAISQAPAGGLTERRTGIEIMQVNEKMKEFGGVWRWTNTHQQMADGLTKLQVRQQFVEKLRRMTHALKYDATFTAGKKVSQQERNKNEQELNDAAADFDEANAVDQTPDEVPAREMVKATRAGTRTARRLAALVAITAATTTKAEETCPSLDINETQWIYVTVLTMLLVVMVLVCGCCLCVTCYIKRANERFWRTNNEEMKRCLKDTPDSCGDDNAEYMQMKIKMSEQADEIERLKEKNEGQRTKIEERAKQIVDMQPDMEKLMTDFEQRGKSLAAYEEKLTKTEKLLKDANEELGLCYKRLSALNGSNDKLERQLNNVKNELRQMTLRARDVPEPKRMRFQVIQSMNEPTVITTEEFTAGVPAAWVGRALALAVLLRRLVRSQCRRLLDGKRKALAEIRRPETARINTTVDQNQLQELRSHVDATKTTLIAAVAKVEGWLAGFSAAVTESCNAIDKRIVFRLHTVGERHSEHEAGVDILEEHITVFQRRLGDIREAKPVPPVTSKKFDRKVDTAIFNFRTKLSVARAKISSAVEPWLPRANLNAHEYESERGGINHFLVSTFAAESLQHHVFVKGDFPTAVAGKDRQPSDGYVIASWPQGEFWKCA